MNYPRCLLVCCATLFFQASALLAADPQVQETHRAWQLESGKVSVDVFAASNSKSGPAILVLHGAGGTFLDGPEMRRVARYLAQAGNTVYLLHYFQSTGTLIATDGTMQRNFSRWLRVVRESVAQVRKEHGAQPVGIYGYSLGGFLAVLAASDNPAVGAIVEHAGGVWNNRLERVGKMPAVMMIHGRRDRRVPFEKYAEPLLPVLRKRARLVETRFFSEEGHGFTPAAMVEVREIAARFFRRQLQSGH